MAKAKTIFIWEGPDAITITRGFDLKRDEKVPYLFNTKVKYKGLFQQMFSVRNIDEMYLGQPKKLIVKDEIMDGWQVIRVKKDFLTHEPFIPDVPPQLAAQLKSLRNEIEIYKKKYFDSKRLNEDREQKDRYRGRVLEEFDFVAKAKNKFYSEGTGWGGGFSSRWGLPPVGGGMSQGNEE
jgi:hypothetical protein